MLFPAAAMTSKFRALALGALVSILTVIAVLAAAEAVCYVLNRSAWKDAGLGLLPHPHLSGANPRLVGPGRYQVESGFGSLPTVNPAPKLPPFTPELLDYSQQHLKHYLVRKNDIYIPRPNCRARSLVRLQDGGRLIYDVHYSIDEHSRRRTPGQNGERPAFALFLGASFTYGEGVEDNETLPYFFSRKASGYRSYNYGVPAYGPNTILKRMFSTDLRSEIKERSGIAFYILLDYHMARLIGPMSYCNQMSWNTEQPYFAEDHDGRVVWRGTFRSGRPLTTRIYAWLGHSQIVRFLHLNFPLFWTNRHYRLLAKVLQEIKAEYARRMGNDNFCVVFYPGTTLPRGLIPYLERMRIAYLDYSDFDPGRYTLKPTRMEFDGHPTAQANRLLGRQLAQDILHARKLTD